MADQMHLVLTKARDVHTGDLVWRNDDVYRVFDVEPDLLHGRVTIRLEACRWGDLSVALTAPVPVEMLS